METRPGLTRDADPNVCWFAARAMEALVEVYFATTNNLTCRPENAIEEIPRLSFDLAEAMVREYKRRMSENRGCK